MSPKGGDMVSEKTSKPPPSQSSARHASRENSSSPARASSTENRVVSESGTRISPILSGAAQGKEKRASKRLEEERKEIERRFRKLEETELMKEATGSKRESRRLTKKQPIGRSSRSSSVSSDKSRSSITHLATLFSRSKNGSRSRSNSVGRDGERASIEWLSTEQTQSNNGSRTQPLPRPPSIILPERFGTAVSSKLGLKNNILLPVSMKQPDHASTEFANVRRPLGYLNPAEAQNTNSQDGNTPFSYSPQRTHLNGQEKPSDDALKSPSKEISGAQQNLDRSAFSANLSAGKRDGGNASHLVQIPPVLRCRVRGKLRSARINRQKMRSIKASSSGEFIGGYRYKKFKSSPLAAAPATSENINLPSKDQEKKDSPISGISVKQMPTRTAPEEPASPLASSKLHGRGSRRLRKLPGSPSNTFAKTATGSWTDLLNDATRLANNSSQFLGRGSSKNQESRLQVLSGPDSKSENAIHSSRFPTGPRFYNGQTPMSNVHTLNGLRGPKSRPVSTKSDPTVSIPLAHRNSDTSQSHSALEARHRSFQLPQHYSSSTEMVQPREKSNSIPSRRPSQDSHSEDYNTADEAASIAESYSSVAQNLGPNNHSPGYSRGDDDKKTSTDINNPELTQLSSCQKPQMTIPAKSVNGLQQGQSVAKVFVVCCHCGFWHDVPSEIFAKLSHTSVSPNPRGRGSPAHETNGELRRNFPERPEERSPEPHINTSFNQASRKKTIAQLPDSSYASSSVVHCSWCDHIISSSCCQGWHTVVNLRERHNWV
ncbi:hypothetical protein PHISCL_06792 [Aspergillus sclerotialis]|uniref:Uncharacterized protein n=1 Tax=Aspergillus sclerotialis TaxID=2070753 RepID=A0A3A2ZCH9_9EURO|nr:hypothetical protein PHISCL_06792 [Aspergillus sclerotialis]